MSDTVMKGFVLIGIIAVIGILATIAIVTINDISLKIEEYQRQYRIKHRFDKPPTAKCYCRDCKKWEPETGKCYDHCNSRLMADNLFCCFAEPITGEICKQREERIKKNKEGEKRNDT